VRGRAYGLAQKAREHEEFATRLVASAVHHQAHKEADAGAQNHDGTCLPVKGCREVATGSRRGDRHSNGNDQHASQVLRKPLGSRRGDDGQRSDESNTPRVAEPECDGESEEESAG
jgi:hypothetical protein